MKNHFAFFVCVFIYRIVLSQPIPDIMLSQGELVDLYGTAVAAGDINNDGFDDVIVGAPLTESAGVSAAGKVFIYMGTPAGVTNIPDDVLDIPYNDFQQFGYSVASGGDVNGDGFGDVIVGVPLGYNLTTKGLVYVFLGSDTGIISIPVDTLSCDKIDSHFGHSISSAGDVNADGYDDIIVGASRYTNGQYREGCVFVFHGSATGVSNIAATKIEGNQVQGYLGSSVSAAGDVNGDGYDDIIAGAPYYDHPTIDEGIAYIYQGSSAGISEIPAATLENNQLSAYMGYSVSGGGDINGDGYDDVVVGSQGYNAPFGNGGRVYVYFGSSSGVTVSTPTIPSGGAVFSSFGYRVKIAGDVNNDSYSDVVVSTVESAYDKIYIFNGSPDGLNTTAAFIADDLNSGERFGVSLGGGDINGDGYSDLIAGANYDTYAMEFGRVYIYYMSCDTPSTFYEDSDADGYGNSAVTLSACASPAGYIADSTDCNDTVSAIHPGLPEICNGIDNNCNTLIDDEATLDAVVLPSGPTSFCTGENVTLNAPLDASYTYQWKKNGVNITGATSASFTANNTGQYQVFISNGSCDDLSDSIPVVKNPKPNPNINNLDATNDLCFDTSIKLKTGAGAGYSYQWYKGAALLTGATSNIYFATLSGNYKVKVTNSFGCSKTSAPYSIIKTCRLGDEQGEDNVSVSVYPNPGNGNFNIVLNGFDENELILMSIKNMMGEEVYAEKINATELNHQITLTDDIAAGIYMIYLQNGNKAFSQKVVIQK